MFEFKREVIHPEDTIILDKYEQMREYYKVKYSIARKANPKVIAEIGVRAGYSGWTFLQAAPKARYYALDANNGEYGGGGVDEYGWWEYAQKLLADYDTVFKEINTQVSSTLEYVIPEKVDFFHIDGDHSRAGVIHDLCLATGVLSEDGVILVDDITYLNPVREGVEAWLKANDEFKGEFVESLRGEMVITRKEK